MNNTLENLGTNVEKDLIYGMVEGRNLLLDLYWFPKATEPMPLIIWVHGGA